VLPDSTHDTPVIVAGDWPGALAPAVFLANDAGNSDVIFCARADESSWFAPPLLLPPQPASRATEAAVAIHP